MFIVFPFILAFLNRVRGGKFKNYWNSTLGWKVIASIGVMISSYYILSLSIFYSIILAVSWFLFQLPGYGAWIDMGHNSPQFERGGVLTYFYKELSVRINNQNIVDYILLTMRGFLVVIVFIVMSIALNNWMIMFLTIPAAFLWSFGYWIAWKLNNPDNSEYFSGFFLGLIIILSFVI